MPSSSDARAASSFLLLGPFLTEVSWHYVCVSFFLLVCFCVCDTQKWFASLEGHAIKFGSRVYSQLL